MTEVRDPDLNMPSVKAAVGRSGSDADPALTTWVTGDMLLTSMNPSCLLHSIFQNCFGD